MSDPEAAGDCEGVEENPQPEDEADLASSDTPTHPHPQDPPTSTQSHPDETSSPPQAQAGAGDTANSEHASAVEHFPSQASCDGCVEPPLAVEGCVGGGPGEDGGVEAEVQQGWPPESDRTSDACQVGSGSAGSSGENNDRDSALPVCGGGRESERRGDVNTAGDRGVALVEQSLVNGTLPHVSSSCYDLDSPPEDERFPAQALCEQNNDREGADDALETDSTEQSLNQNSTPKANEDTAPTAEPKAESCAQPPLTPSSQASPALAALEQSASVSSELSTSVGDKEDDQVPECDREAVAHPSSSPQASFSQPATNGQEVSFDPIPSTSEGSSCKVPVINSESAVYDERDLVNEKLSSESEVLTASANSSPILPAPARRSDSDSQAASLASASVSVDRPSMCDNHGDASDCDTVAAVGQSGTGNKACDTVASVSQPGSIASASQPDTSTASASQPGTSRSSVSMPGTSTSSVSQAGTSTASVSQASISSGSPPQHRPGLAECETSVLNKPYFLDDDSEEEELLTELDAELQLRCSPHQQQQQAQQQQQQQEEGASGSCGGVRLSMNGLKEVGVNNSELCKQFEDQLMQLQQTVLERDREISRLKAQKDRQREVSQEVIAERDNLRAEVASFRDKNPDDLYLPQIKELEYTISQQQVEVRHLKEKLTSHDSAAKRAITTLQSEMKARIDQITKLYEDCCREKDAMVVKFAQAETKNMEVKCAQEKMEARVRDLLKEKEFNNNKTRAAMAEKQKAVAELKAKMGEVAGVQKEMDKLKEELSSADYRIKWHQNKLKAEQDAHKDTRLNLERTTAKLKEAREETEMIRKDCQAIVKTYQESEEVRSNSLDKELKMKETELMIKQKEHSDTEEIHLRTKQELDKLKAHHKDSMEELKTLKDKVQCLEEERLQAEQVQSQYQNIIQSQKSENASLNRQVAALQTLQEDFDRAQEMIKNLDGEVSSLKLTNRDLQKDAESCQARESKMLTLQSELSRTNALLRSENTSLNNQVATLSGEVQKLTMDIQELETRCRNVADQLQEESSKRQEETSSLSAQLATKSKESEDYRQKWEDEIDANKTWKRKHTSNVKDLTRQLQQAKKRLEQYESGGGGGGDRDATSMGSRTNSNGSLNSMDNSANHHHHHHHHNAHSTTTLNPPSRPASQEPEFPVIKEQVEVDKQLLIERIVKLQRSLARKNEKLDFVEEHIQQLVQEIKKKNRIIQGYVMREEAGTLASDVMDANKALLARKGGIMASVYSHHQQDGAMTLDLSLQINQKLQAVLEDTLLKNITLKENLDTLGAEIARLSQENRRLQLQLQGLDTQ